MKEMFGRFPLPFNGGVNPPHMPSYPMHWEAHQYRVDIHVEVDAAYVKEILSRTVFEPVNNRAVFRYLDARGHTLARYYGGFNETLVEIPVRYKGVLGVTYIFHYTSDEIANIAGRELLGYSKKDAITRLYFDSERKWGKTLRRDETLTEFQFVPRPDAVLPPLVEGETPNGAIHQRRLPYPDRPETCYSDVIFRKYQFQPEVDIHGDATLSVFESEWDPIARLNPRVIGAHYLAGPFGGGPETEQRKILDVITLPDMAQRDLREPSAVVTA